MNSFIKQEKTPASEVEPMIQGNTLFDEAVATSTKDRFAL